jgi:hypothetical protein
MLLNLIDGRTENKPEEIEITPEVIEAAAIELFSWEASGNAECMRAVFIAMEQALEEQRRRASRQNR